MLCLVRWLCGNRDWGLRPDTQTICHMKMLASQNVGNGTRLLLARSKQSPVNAADSTGRCNKLAESFSRRFVV
jgi:hypothetical protein